MAADAVVVPTAAMSVLHRTDGAEHRSAGQFADAGLRTMTTILLCADTDVERVSDQVESITNLPLETDRVRVLVYHVFRAGGADASDLKSVSRAVESLEAAGFETEVRQSSGDAVENIIETAEEVDADVISIAGRKRSPAGKALFGSVTQQVALHSDRPVLFASMGD